MGELARLTLPEKATKQGSLSVQWRLCAFQDQND